MSAPTSAAGDASPPEGYYPDPSIPGYVRYWSGTGWVAGTSRPAPADGAPLTPPPGYPRPAPAPAPQATAPEETGPLFFDGPQGEDGPRQFGPESQGQHVASAVPHDGFGPAPIWGVDVGARSGYGADAEPHVSWGSTPQPYPHQAPDEDRTPERRVPRPAESRESVREQDRPPLEPVRPQIPDTRHRPEGTVALHRPAGPVEPVRPAGRAAGQPAAERPAPRRTEEAAALPPGPPAPRAVTGGTSRGEGTMSLRAAEQHRADPPPVHPQPVHPQPVHSQPVPPQPVAPRTVAPRPVEPAHRQPPPAAPSPAPAPAPSPAPAPGPSWVQQVSALAGPERAGAGGQAGQDGGERVVPWKPVTTDPFVAAAQARAAARPASPGRRLLARIFDGVLLGLLTGAAVLPLAGRAVDHVRAKVDAARQSGRTVEVWLLDSTTGAYLGAAIGVLLVLGLLYDVWPTAKWGRTLGKKLFGLQVRDIEEHEPPTFGAALRRWLVFSVPGLLLVGVIGVVWGLFDRPWRQCWHDKAAHTFVAR